MVSARAGAILALPAKALISDSAASDSDRQRRHRRRRGSCRGVAAGDQRDGLLRRSRHRKNGSRSPSPAATGSGFTVRAFRLGHRLDPSTRAERFGELAFAL